MRTKNRVEYIKKLFLIFTLSLIINLTALIPPIYTLNVYDRVLTSHSLTTLISLTMIVAAMLAIAFLVEAYRIEAQHSLAGMLHSELLENDIKNSKPNGSQWRTVETERSVIEFVQGAGLGAFLDTLFIPIFLTVLYLLHPLLGYTTIILLAILYILAELTDRKLQLNWEPQVAANKKVNETKIQLDELAIFTKYISINQRFRKLYSHNLVEQNAIQSLTNKVKGLGDAAVKNMNYLSVIIVTAVAAFLAVEKEITTGAIFAALMIAARSFIPVAGFKKGFKRAKNLKLLLLDLIKDNGLSDPQTTTIAPKNPRVLLRDVTLINPKENRRIITKLTMDINPGDKICVLGPVGSGQSDLIELLATGSRRYIGKVIYLERELRDWDEFPKGVVGYMPYQLKFISGLNLLENLRLFCPEDEERKVFDAICDIGLSEKINSLKKGLNTDSFEEFSTGEIRLLNLVRSSWYMPNLLFLDHPTEGLDGSAERRAIAYLNSARFNNTAMVYSSQSKVLSEISNKTLVLASGVVKFYGASDKLQDISIKK